jgi:hypothetical protein
MPFIGWMSISPTLLKEGSSLACAVIRAKSCSLIFTILLLSFMTSLLFKLLFNLPFAEISTITTTFWLLLLLGEMLMIGTTMAKSLTHIGFIENSFIELGLFCQDKMIPLLSLSFISITLPWLLIATCKLNLPPDWITQLCKNFRTCFIILTLLSSFISMHTRYQIKSLLKITAQLSFTLILTLIGIAICHRILELRRLLFFCLERVIGLKIVKILSYIATMDSFIKLVTCILSTLPCAMSFSFPLASLVGMLISHIRS